MSFNDPWDFRPNFSSEIPVEPATRERNIQWLDAMSRKYHAHLPEEEHLRRARNQKEDEAYFAWLVSEVSARTAQAAVDRYRVYCVSAAPDNTLMWSHYAASHTGICLEFACRNKVFGTAIRVQYLSRYPAFDLFDNADDTILLPWLTKSDAWSYEQEFRVIAQEKVATPPPPDEVLVTRNGLLKLPPGASKSVILGCSISPAAAAHIRSLVRRANLSVCRSKKDGAPSRPI